MWLPFRLIAEPECLKVFVAVHFTYVLNYWRQSYSFFIKSPNPFLDAYLIFPQRNTPIKTYAKRTKTNFAPHKNQEIPET